MCRTGDACAKHLFPWMWKCVLTDDPNHVHVGFFFVLPANGLKDWVLHMFIYRGKKQIQFFVWNFDFKLKAISFVERQTALRFLDYTNDNMIMWLFKHCQREEVRKHHCFYCDLIKPIVVLCLRQICPHPSCSIVKPFQPDREVLVIKSTAGLSCTAMFQFTMIFAVTWLLSDVWVFW